MSAARTCRCSPPRDHLGTPPGVPPGESGGNRRNTAHLHPLTLSTAMENKPMDTNVTDADDISAQRVIGARFRAAREAAGLSRAQVERASNVSQKAIEKFE